MLVDALYYIRMTGRDAVAYSAPCSPQRNHAPLAPGCNKGGMFARRAPGACPARYLCIWYLISSPKFILTLGSPPSRPH